MLLSPRRLALAALCLLPALSSTALAKDQDRWAKLQSESKDGTIKLDSVLYDEILASPRNYSVSVVLTALPLQMNCGPCREFDPVFRSVSSSWKKLPEAQRRDHFFAVLDFPDGQDIYRRLGLSTAPTMQFHGATDGPHSNPNRQPMISYDFGRNGFSIDALHAHVNSLAPHNFKLHKPFNPWPFIVIPLVLVGIIGTVVLAYPVILPILQSKHVWTFGCLAAIIVFISGHMWNRIRTPPYAQPGSIIASGFSNQFVLESQIVAAIYAVCSFSVIALAQLVPGVKGAGKQRLAAILWLTVLVIMFSMLLRIFKFKNGGYPFALLFG